MAQMNFGGVIENVMTREEFPLEKAREVLKDETIAVIGYGVQGPGQSLNLRDNGFNVIVGQRQGKTYDKAVADGWVPGETLFSIEEACQKATIIMCLLSDAAVISVWPTIKPCLTAGKALYFSHGFAITWNDRTGVVPPTDVDVIMVAPKGSGTSLRTMFLEGLSEAAASGGGSGGAFHPPHDRGLSPAAGFCQKSHPHRGHPALHDPCGQCDSGSFLDTAVPGLSPGPGAFGGGDSHVHHCGPFHALGHQVRHPGHGNGAGPDFPESLG